jgi:hypothetical protein
LREKRCSKCSYGKIHHEFDCREYAEYSEVAKFPPAISEANSTAVISNPKN